VTDWKEVLSEACGRAQAVAEKASAGRGRSREVGVGASGDRTLAADRDAEEEILDSLSGIAGLRIISEEIGEVGDKAGRVTAIVDPIDGSSNFGRAIPFYCTSIAIVEGTHLRDVRHAMVRNLVNGDVYYSERGCGSTKNGRLIRTSTESEASESVVGIDMSRASEGTIIDLAPLISRVKRQVHFGANALELCLVAEGKEEAFVDVRGRMRITDFAGGYLIASEAGAVVSNPQGAELDPALRLGERFGFVVSANDELHRVVLGLLRRERPSARRS
jgi:myo-inositol-1(or 4)-monophosphatase